MKKKDIRSFNQPVRWKDMVNKAGSPVKEGWTGPGRRDAEIKPLTPAEDGLHIDMAKKGSYEWWYFDAHFQSGHTLVIFFHAANPNPGMGGKPGIEIMLLRPDGRKTQRFIPYSRSDFIASRDGADVRAGENYLKAVQTEGGLPVYEIYISEKDFSCRLTYRAEVNGWKPGTGFSQFGKMGYFAWVVPFARASVEGTITDKGNMLQVRGIGYHDHNWLNFQFPVIIDYWMWGRVYSEHYTMSYAYIQCNGRMGDYAVKVLMLAEGREVILSTGEFDFNKADFEYNPGAKHSYPKQLTIKVPGQMEANLRVKEVLEAEDMLNNFAPVLRFIAKNLLRLKPGYFRLASDFEISVTRDAKTNHETGTTLHEIVMFKPAR
jgi:predicted secreted hydrolase